MPRPQKGPDKLARKVDVPFRAVDVAAIDAAADEDGTSRTAWVRKAALTALRNRADSGAEKN